MWTPGSITWTDTSQNWIQKKGNYCNLQEFMTCNFGWNPILWDCMIFASIQPNLWVWRWGPQQCDLVSWQLPWLHPLPAWPSVCLPPAQAPGLLRWSRWRSLHGVEGDLGAAGSRGSSGRFSLKPIHWYGPLGHMGMAGMAQNPHTLLFTPKQLVSTDIHLTI